MLAPVSVPELSGRLGANARALVRMSSPDERVTAEIVLLGRARVAAIVTALQKAGCRILFQIQSQNVLAVETPVALLDRLARLEGVASVEVEESLQPS